MRYHDLVKKSSHLEECVRRIHDVILRFQCALQVTPVDNRRSISTNCSSSRLHSWSSIANHANSNQSSAFTTSIRVYCYSIRLTTSFSSTNYQVCLHLTLFRVCSVFVKGYCRKLIRIQFVFV